MKRVNILIGLLIGILLMSQCILAGGAEKKKKSKVQLELYVGHSRVMPDDLNLIPDYNLWNNHQSGLRKYSYYHDTGNNYDFFYKDQGEFKKIEFAIPVGIRLKLFLTPRFAVSAGFRIMSRKEASTLSEEFDVSYLEPDYAPFSRKFIDSRIYDPADISFASYVLHVGNHHIFRLNQVWSGELFYAAGLGYTTCRHEDLITTKVTYSMEDSVNDYWEERIYSIQYKGDGLAFFSELGFRLNIQWHPKISFFLEASANSLNFANINGPGQYQASYKDSNGEGYQTTWEGEGQWKITEINYSNNWGYFSRQRPYIDDGNSTDREFELNLSGFQFRFGIGYRF